YRLSLSGDNCNKLSLLGSGEGGDMDYRWTEQQEAFRNEIRDFLRAELPPDWSQGAGEDEEGERQDFERDFAQKLGEKGWLVCGWPEEYGGRGWGVFQQMLFKEEMELAKAPRKYMGAGITQVGPPLILFGTDEQKKQHLGPIARGEVKWCQLFSEPDAGSDLFSLKTTAEDRGDYFLLNGQKIWTSGGHEAEWGILLARTDPDLPRHRGISFFLLDLSLPGISFKPIINMVGVHSFNTFFFDNVQVPKSALVGGINNGAKVTAATLNSERSGIGATIPALQLFTELVEFCKARGVNGYEPLKANPSLRHRIAQLAIELQVARDLSYRVGWMQSEGENPSAEASIARVFATELTQRVTALGMEILGLWSQLSKDSKINVLRGKVSRLYLGQRAITIGAGTSEIQRNGIALRGLGLPRN
ncbi:acyl-CoA dehydrogenase family protein, partial [Dehalococcoidia bacterium]|nr:acyl-CoA dehydrogenase family protein [Dehalococcoidia bacterium]